jgi:CTP synthase (UTP-ammonia lyase)
MRDKMALFCNVPPEAVIQALDEPTIYKVPLSLYEQKFDSLVLKYLSLESPREPDLADWQRVVDGFCAPSGEVEIVMVGKYINHKDAYLSVTEALYHAGIHHDVRVKIRSVEAEDIEEQGADAILSGACGIIVPAGSVPGGSRARSPPRGTPGRRKFPTSACAWACRWRWWSSPATSAAYLERTARKSTPDAPAL